MIYVNAPRGKLGDTVYDPIQKKLVPSKSAKRRNRRERIERKRQNKPKGRRNISDAYPGYIFTINGRGYICVDGGREDPTELIPVKVYSKVDRAEELRLMRSQPRTRATRAQANSFDKLIGE